MDVRIHFALDPAWKSVDLEFLHCHWLQLSVTQFIFPFKRCKTGLTWIKMCTFLSDLPYINPTVRELWRFWTGVTQGANGCVLVHTGYCASCWETVVNPDTDPVRLSWTEWKPRPLNRICWNREFMAETWIWKRGLLEVMKTRRNEVRIQGLPVCQNETDILSFVGPSCTCCCFPGESASVIQFLGLSGERRFYPRTGGQGSHFPSFFSFNIFDTGLLI